MDLFLNYFDYFILVKKRFESIQAGNQAWKDQNLEALQVIADNSSGQWSDEYVKKAKEVLADFDLFSQRIDQMCLTFAEADLQAIAMLARCNCFIYSLYGFDVKEKHSVHSAVGCANDLMYDGQYYDKIVNNVEHVYDVTQEEKKLEVQIADLVDALEIMDKQGLKDDLDNMVDGFGEQDHVENFEQDFKYYVGEVNEFNTTISTMFTDVVGEWTDIPQFKRVADYEQYIADNYAHVTSYAEDGMSDVFDGEGDYGADQGGPLYGRKTDKEFLQWVRDNYPEFADATDEEIIEYFDKYNSGGCGYAAMVNTLLSAYADDPDAFKEKYGIPLYDENGDFNYDAIFYDFCHDTYGQYSSCEDALVAYCEAHGDEVEYSSATNLSQEQYAELVGEGYVIVASSSGYTLYNEDGTVYTEDGGGHAMVITEVLPDGRYKVSSWGKEYYLDPSDGNISFKKVKVNPQ